MINTKLILLDCGVEAEYWLYQKIEYLQISLFDMYNGYGKLSNTLLLAQLFTELSNKGYNVNGIYLQTGCYDSVDDLELTVNRKYTKK